MEHQKPKSVQPFVIPYSIADVQQLCAILSVAGVDLARDEREPPAARPRLLDQLLRLLRQARPEEVLSLDTRIDTWSCVVKFGMSVIFECAKTPVLSKMQVPEGGEQEARVDVPDRGSNAEHSRGGKSMRGDFATFMIMTSGGNR